jgi:hypothetical protein
MGLLVHWMEVSKPLYSSVVGCGLIHSLFS